MNRTEAPRRARGITRFVTAFGPGLAVMLADTDVGSIVTAGQSGVQWGYRLLVLQLVLMPVLYLIQELAARLGIFTRRGHGELIRETFGPVWAWTAVTFLTVATVGALITEFSGVAGVGELYGVPRPISLAIAVAGLLGIVLTGSYRRVERLAIAFGLCELAFFGVAWAAHADPHAVLRDSLDLPLRNPSFIWLAAANIGTIVTPCMIFYQQAAIAEKRLGSEHYTSARLDTAIGALVCQGVMMAVTIACAATIGRSGTRESLETVGQISQALTPFLGETFGLLVFSFGVLGAAIVATVVCSLAFAWGLGEVTGYSHSFERHPLRARWFYGVYAVCIIGGAIAVALWPDLVSLNIAVQVINGLMLPLVFGLLIALAIKALPDAYRLRGAHLWLVLSVATATCAGAILAGIFGF